MSQEIIKYIFFFLMGTSVLNFAIAVLVRYKTKHKEFNTLLYYWPAIILTFVAAAILSQTPTQIAIAYFFQIISSNLIVKMMCSAQGIKFHWKPYIGVQLATMVLATFLLTQNQIDFTFAVLPVSMAFAMPFVVPIWHSLVRNRINSSWIEKAMGVVFITGMINHLNYALFRMDPNAAFWGWSVSIAQYQCLSLFLPLLINHRREENERKKLKGAIEKLSGNLIQSSKTDELYSQLEIEIAEKSEASLNLRKINSSLLDQREINELLIQTISHDLSNPISAIQLTLQRLLSKKLNEEDVQKSFSLMERSAKSAILMISNIRKAILTRSQEHLIRIENISLTHCLKRVQDQFESSLAAKNIRFEVENRLTCSDSIRGNEEALVDHVFSNILSNAIKFSHPNSNIVVTIEDAQDQIQISFKDSGIGLILPEKHSRLAIPQIGTAGEKGSGFGLIIINYFLRHFDGHFSMQSDKDGPNQGTTVTIKLNKPRSS